MKDKINIAQLLKDCPRGIELDCAIWDSDAKVFFKEVLNDDFAYPVVVTIKYNNIECTKSFTKYGSFNDLPYCKCVIFPKGKTTWEEFQRPFNDGDIIFTHANCLKVGLGNTWISIFQEKRNGGVATYVDMTEDGKDYYDYIDGDKGLLCMNEDIMRQRLATEEEKEKLFDAIKANGYRWNAETKTLEKLIEPKFKVGDKVSSKYLKNYEIEKMEWDDTNNRVIYKLRGMGWYSADELQPYKEETMEETIKIDVPKGYEFAGVDDDNQQVVFTKIQPEYPTTYEECFNICFGNKHHIVQVVGLDGLGDNKELFESFIKLKICRDAYWKIAGEQMGLEEPWKPVLGENFIYAIGTCYGTIEKRMVTGGSGILLFPTEEMRDAFYENFKDLIEKCKELL